MEEVGASVLSSLYQVGAVTALRFRHNMLFYGIGPMSVKYYRLVSVLEGNKSAR